MKPIKALIAFLILGCTLSSCLSLIPDENPQDLIPIQYRGRVKPFSAFSNQILQIITHKNRWENQSASNVIFGLLAETRAASSKEWIRLDFPELKSELGLSQNRHYFSLDELKSSYPKIEGYLRSAQKKRDRDERPTKLEQKAESLYTKINWVQEISTGNVFKVIPGATESAWSSPFTGPKNSWANSFLELAELYHGPPEHFRSKALEWCQRSFENSPSTSPARLKLEILYYQLNLFEKSWVFYLLAFLFLSYLGKRSQLKKAGFIFFGLALAAHLLGIILRVIILERPPVSNMFESMVYMNLILILAASVFAFVRRNRAVLSVGSLVSAFIMIYSGTLPLDSNLDVLVPVLRSNYWLTIHVMVIVASYGLFGLAMGMGHRHLFLDAMGRMTKEARENSSSLIYKIIQFGILLIGVGTVLGGVWANESWGRFWGWDPKETWALITFLGYLLIIHLKFVNVINPFGMAVGSILGFLLVLMTWYGVNFVLGRGLHSYGFGSGGMNWIIYYLIFEGLFLGFIFLKKYSIIRR